MWKRAHGKPSSEVLKGLKALNTSAQKKLKGASRNSKVSKDSDELDLNLHFFNHVYGMNTSRLAEALGVDESTVRKRIKRSKDNPDNSTLIQDVYRFIDDPKTDNGDERHLMWRSHTKAFASRFDVDIPKRGTTPYDYSSNPDMSYTVVTSMEQLFEQPEQEPFYVTGDVYKYCIGEL